MKGIYLAMGLFLSLLMIVVALQGILLNTYYDINARHAYHQSVEYVMGLASQDEDFSLTGFMKRISLWGYKGEAELIGYHQYPKFFNLRFILAKPNGLTLTLQAPMLEDLAYE